MKRLIEIAAVGAGLVLVTAGTASAGEVKGNGDPLPPKDNASECAFSGLDTADSIEGPGGMGDDGLGARGNQSPGGVDRYHGVQNYGMFVRAGLKGVVPSPGIACNGSGG